MCRCVPVEVLERGGHSRSAIGAKWKPPLCFCGGGFNFFTPTHVMQHHHDGTRRMVHDESGCIELAIAKGHAEVDAEFLLAALELILDLKRPAAPLDCKVKPHHRSKPPAKQFPGRPSRALVYY